MDVWFVAWDISDQDAAMTGRALLSVPSHCRDEFIWWDNRRWKCVGAVKSDQHGRDWLICEPA